MFLLVGLHDTISLDHEEATMTIDIETATQRYKQRTMFYAWDIYEALSKRYPSAYALLQHIRYMDTPVDAEEIASATPWSLRHVQKQLKFLATYGFLHRGKAADLPRTYTYRLSALGEVVLSGDVKGPAGQPDRAAVPRREGRAGDLVAHPTPDAGIYPTELRVPQSEGAEPGH
jgi:hypothetical protein